MKKLVAIAALASAALSVPAVVLTTALDASASPGTSCGGPLPLIPGNTCRWTLSRNPGGATGTWNLYFRFAEPEPSWRVQWGFNCATGTESIGVSGPSPVFTVTPLVKYGTQYRQLVRDHKVAPAHGFWTSPGGVPLAKDSSVVTYTGDGQLDLQVMSNCQWSVSV